MSRWVLLGIAALHVLSITYVLVRYLDSRGKTGATASDTRTPAELAPHTPVIRPAPPSSPAADTTPADEAPPAEPAAQGVAAPQAAGALAPSAVTPGSARRAARRAAAAASSQLEEPDVGY
jgi:hypothetical protein